MSNDITSTIGRRIRSERDLRGWSLAELAERSDVSKAMLSAMERGMTSPTAALLVRVASAFGMTLSTLIARAEMQGGGVSRKDEQPVWRDPATGYVRRHLSPASQMPLELIRFSLPAGAKVSFPAASYAFINQQTLLIYCRLSSPSSPLSPPSRPPSPTEAGTRPAAPPPPPPPVRGAVRA